MKDGEEEEEAVVVQRALQVPPQAAAEPHGISAFPEWVDLSSSPADTAEQWVAVADSKAASENFLGSQGSVPAALAPRAMCSLRIPLSSECQRSLCLLLTQRCWHSAHMCLSAQAEPQNPVVQPQDTHKGTGMQKDPSPD